MTLITHEEDWLFKFRMCNQGLAFLDSTKHTSAPIKAQQSTPNLVFLLLWTCCFVLMQPAFLAKKFAKWISLFTLQHQPGNTSVKTRQREQEICGHNRNWAVIYCALKRQIRELLLITVCSGIVILTSETRVWREGSARAVRIWVRSNTSSV